MKNEKERSLEVARRMELSRAKPSHGPPRPRIRVLDGLSFTRPALWDGIWTLESMVNTLLVKEIGHSLMNLRRKRRDFDRFDSNFSFSKLVSTKLHHSLLPYLAIDS